MATGDVFYHVIQRKTNAPLRSTAQVILRIMRNFTNGGEEIFSNQKINIMKFQVPQRKIIQGYTSSAYTYKSTEFASSSKISQDKYHISSACMYTPAWEYAGRRR